MPQRFSVHRWSSRISWRQLMVWSVAMTVVAESVTLALRFFGGITALQLNQSAPLFVQIHHMFWSVPLMGVAIVLRARPRAVIWLSAMAIACVLSDLAHHLLFLPMIVGNTGWHWP